MKNTYNLIIKVLSSNYFLWFLIGFFILESSWIAFSFAYPMLYDEIYHFGVIKLFSNQFSPVIINQPTSYDYYGNLTFNNASLYHYFMSIPYRILGLITETESVKIISLRLLNIFMFAGGIYVYSRVFKRINIQQKLINISVFLLILLPIVPFVAATINYDNMLMLFSALFFLECIKYIQNKKADYINVLSFLIIGMIASLIKFTFLPIFVLGSLYLLVYTYKRSKLNFVNEVRASAAMLKRYTLIASLVLFILVSSMFAFRYLTSVVIYRSPIPECQIVMARERCFSSPIIKEAITLAETKNSRTLMAFPDYVFVWFSANLNHINTTSSSMGVDWPKPLPVMNTGVFVLIITGIGVLVYQWRSIKKNDSWYFLLYATVTYALILFLDNYTRYLNLHLPYAIQPRYLLVVLPIILVMMVVATNSAFRSRSWVKIVILSLVLIMLTQGGGFITHIVRSKDFWYWNNHIVIRVNNNIKNIINPLVIE